MIRQRPGRQVARTHWYFARWCAFHKWPCAPVCPPSMKTPYWPCDASTHCHCANDYRYGLDLA